MYGTRLAAQSFDSAADTPLRRALQACRTQFLLVGLFSGAVNLLQLTTSVYMMQVFDRVLATRVLDTLLYLSPSASVSSEQRRWWEDAIDGLERSPALAGPGMRGPESNSSICAML